jgi:2-iminobutanoate/2-iminopropanoate deaminase
MSSSRQKVVAEALYSRVVDGRVLFPHAVSVSGMRTIWLAGQLAYNKAGQIVGHGDMRAQFRQTSLNIKAALEAAGASLDDVVKLTFYVTDIDEYFRCFDIREEFFGKAFPASTSI